MSKNTGKFSKKIQEIFLKKDYLHQHQAKNIGINMINQENNEKDNKN